MIYSQIQARGIPTAAYQVLHLLSCTGWVPHLSRGYPPWVPPHPDLAGVYPIPTGGVLHLGYLTLVSPVLTRSGVPHPYWGYPTSGTPIWPWLGYPFLDLARVSPHLDLDGVPPCLDLAGVPSPSLARWGTPLWTDRWMHRHMLNHNLPSYYVRDMQ